MNHRGVEFCVEQAPVREDVWIWRYQVDGEVRTGKTLTRLRPLAIRRVQSAIDRELRKRGVPYASGIGGENLKAKTVRRICIIRHSAVPDSGSYEVRFADGRESRFFYFDDVLARRLRPDILTSEQALEQAKASARAERDKRQDEVRP